MWSNGELIDNSNYEEYVVEIQAEHKKFEIQTRIQKLKMLLAETDYRAIKYAEGLYTEEEYAPYKEQRKAYRDEINSLEKEIK